MESHLLQMRGLKRKVVRLSVCRQNVASFTDAWIETISSVMPTSQMASHLLQMRGLKPISR